MADLLTLLHISDLHLGEIDPVTGNARVSSAAAKLFAQFSWFDGVLGHSGRALQDLEVFQRSLGTNGEPLRLIVSGDITRCGNGAEFIIAGGYLSADIDLNPPNNNRVGLRHAFWRYAAIPGNHDHWSGTPHPWGGPTKDLLQCFPRTRFPFVESKLLANGRTLQIAGINTDADVRPWGAARTFARGSFQSQLSSLSPMLGRPRDDQVRALLIHHSWHRQGVALSINQGSKAALAQFLVQHDIRVILSGHTHEPLVRKFKPPFKNAQDVLECRSGTASQHDHVPYEWHTLLGKFPSRKWPPNTLLVHRLRDDNGVTYWEAETYLRSPRIGFQSIGSRGTRRIAV